jgi:hypothetical protein
MVDERGKPQVSQKSVLVLNIGGMTIALVTAACAWFITTHLGILSGVSLFSSVRTLLLTSFLVAALPIATLGEYWLSQTNKRKFLWKSVFLTTGILFLFTLITTLLLILFDLLFPGLFLALQMALVVTSALAGLFTIRIAMRNEHLKKWRKEFGWYTR